MPGLPYVMVLCNKIIVRNKCSSKVFHLMRRLAYVSVRKQSSPFSCGCFSAEAYQSEEKLYYLCMFGASILKSKP